jgi:hypothetical protein
MLLNRLCLCAGLLLALSADAGAEGALQKECFAVTMTNAAGGGSLGSILLDKCTGNSWILGRITLSNGATAVRWSPLSVEKSEAVVSAPNR